MEVINLLAIGQSLAIDRDYELSSCAHSTQLLLRLGEGQTYPLECHAKAIETITVLQGQCMLSANQQQFDLAVGEQISIPAGLEHQFLSNSACILLIHFSMLSEGLNDD
ncbi:cupin domain-containing protein [Alginatibacterium sediminis]|uniref:Cupin domain-containing protein n=1 Tax=Alginatibacterium sediminis TaxID=2164068 RepID=A0A420EDL6_9ALTE|nr:cupin domain-containing protein [Alginatibacterium sediminis]RKF18758.1 cupin domain-containing protein [Alginatibacterium sediminis]